jgi:hypothetical protein
MIFPQSIRQGNTGRCDQNGISGAEKWTSVRPCIEARRLFKESTAKHPRHAPSWQAWALMEAKLGNLSTAAKLFRNGEETTRDAARGFVGRNGGGGGGGGGEGGGEGGGGGSGGSRDWEPREVVRAKKEVVLTALRGCPGAVLGDGPDAAAIAQLSAELGEPGEKITSWIGRARGTARQQAAAGPGAGAGAGGAVAGGVGTGAAKKKMKHTKAVSGAPGGSGVGGRGLHSSTSRLKLSRFGHTPPCPPV